MNLLQVKRVFNEFIPRQGASIAFCDKEKKNILGKMGANNQHIRKPESVEDPPEIPRPPLLQACTSVVGMVHLLLWHKYEMRKSGLWRYHHNTHQK
jgi:hypothetical protein